MRAVFFILLGSIVITLPCKAQTKLVFAHYMVCFKDYNNGVAGYRQDIQDAQAIGVDGFVLNCGVWDANYQASVSQMFQAASGTTFKLFFSADMGPSSNPITAANILNMMQTYAGDANYFHYNGRPVLSTFGGEKITGAYGSANASWWLNNVLAPLRNGGINVYFTPYFYTDSQSETPTQADIQANCNGTALDVFGNSYPGWWNQVADGLFYFGVGLPTSSSSSSIITSSRSYATVAHTNGKTYIAPVLSTYWGRRQTTNVNLGANPPYYGNGRRYFEMEGPIGVRAQWNDIIQNQNPEWVELETWNDFNESYISPIPDAYYPWQYWDVNAPGYFHCHSGLGAINAYFIDWYKHYTPATCPPPPGYKDNLYWSYRTVPMSFSSLQDLNGQVTDIRGPIADSIYFMAIMIQPATLQVNSGGTMSWWSLSPGINEIRVPYHVGAQRFDVLGSSSVLMTGFGDPVTTQFTYNGAPTYNFWYTTGSVHD